MKSMIHNFTKEVINCYKGLNQKPSLEGVEGHELNAEKQDRIWASRSPQIGMDEGDFIVIKPEGGNMRVQFGERIPGRGDVIQGNMVVAPTRDKAQDVARMITDVRRVG